MTETATKDLRRASRALISVSDKSGAAEFAHALAEFGIELISTGGTRKMLVDAGLKVLDVCELTGYPEMMDGRVKTLHPAVHGGLLAMRDNTAHVQAMRTHNIRPIDILVVNLYPFEATIARGADFAECLENIDIGGPAMIRAAAKNHDDVVVLVDASDYTALLDELKHHHGSTTLALRRRWRSAPAMSALRAGLPPRLMHAPRPTTPPLPIGSPARLRKLRRTIVPLQAASLNRCATARIRISPPPSTVRPSSGSA